MRSNKALNMLVSGAIAAGGLFSNTSYAANLEDTTNNSATTQTRDYGQNKFQEPDYVKKHFLYSIAGDCLLQYWNKNIKSEDRIPEQKPITYEKHGFLQDGKPKRSVKYDKKHPKFDISTESDIVEYIEDKDGNALGILVTESGDYLRFYEKQGYTTYSLEEVNKNPKMLNANKKRLYEQIKSTPQGLKKIREITYHK